VTSSDDIVLTPRPETSSWVPLWWSSPAAVVPSAARRAVVLALMVIGALATAWSGYVHLKLWNEDRYSEFFPTLAKLFLAQGIVCLVIALAVVVLRRLLVALVGALLMAASIGGLAISLRTTFFGYHEFSDEPYVVAALVVESVAVVAYVAAIVLALTASRPVT
jgi:hypothetical protein